MAVIIIAAIIAVAIVALLFVVNSRLNGRTPELEDYLASPMGQTTSGGRAEGREAKQRHRCRVGRLVTPAI
jgi:hypothetical protein